MVSQFDVTPNTMSSKRYWKREWDRTELAVCVAIFSIFALQILLALNFLVWLQTPWQNAWNPHKILWHASDEYLFPEELDFTPACRINTSTAIYAINRAETQQCKQQIADVACFVDAYYPKFLPNYCSGAGLQKGRDIGCFQFESKFELPNEHYSKSVENSPEKCVEMCQISGFTYAGVRNSTECYCGNQTPSPAAKLPNFMCRRNCSSGQNFCGGQFAMKIYRTSIRKITPNEIASAPSPGVGPVTIAFLLTVSGRDTRQVHRLIKNLYQKNHFYYVHVDAKDDYLFGELTPLEDIFPNIHITRRRFSVIWSGISLFNMLLSCMKELLQLHNEWDFVINLSETDFPIKPIAQLEQFLTANKNKNFVSSCDNVTRFIEEEGFDKTFTECDAHMWRIADRKIPWGIQVDGGSDWVVLTREFVAYALSDDPDELIKGLLMFAYHSLLPSESFFHLALRNSRFCSTYVNDHLRLVNWKKSSGLGACKCTGQVVDWCGCSPRVFRLEDWAVIQETKWEHKFFARKFDPVVDQGVILQLERWLYGEDFRTGMNNLGTHWVNLYSYLDVGEIDDVVLTFMASMLRIHPRFFPHTCNMKGVKALEVTSVHENFADQRILVKYETEPNATLEFSLAPVTNFKLLKLPDFVQRLKHIRVGSGYDQKEKIYRNFAYVMGPYSSPVLSYEFTFSPGSDATKITFLWLDPSGILADVTTLTLNDSYFRAHARLSTKPPHLPGKWTIKIIHEDRFVAKLNFLIYPLEFYGGSRILESQLRMINAGTFSDPQLDPAWERFLPSKERQEKLKRRCITRAKSSIETLQKWIDSLVLLFYNFEGSCVLDDESTMCGLKLQNCKSTDWSSYAADPKSWMGSVEDVLKEFRQL